MAREVPIAPPPRLTAAFLEEADDVLDEEDEDDVDFTVKDDE